VADNKNEITLGLLNSVEGNSQITQRSVAGELGIALGLANSYLKRCIKQGLIKVSQAPKNRYAYYLTPQGIAERSRLTAEYLSQSLDFFRVARQQTGDVLKHCHDRGWRRIALVGKSELAEITILSAAEYNIALIGLIDAEARKTTDSFMALPVVADIGDLDSIDALIVTDMRQPQTTYDKSINTLPADRVLMLPLLGTQNGRKKNGEGAAP